MAKPQNEDWNLTDEGTFASPSSCSSDNEAPSAQCADSEGSPGPSSSCTSDDENGQHSGQEADVDSCESSESGLNSSCASDDEDELSGSTQQDSGQIPLDKLPSVGSVGH